MHFEQILVVKETHKNEGRVALTPSVVARLVNKGYKVLIETDAGLNAGFSNDDYIRVGASLFSLSSSGFPAKTFIMRVLRPSKERELIENKLFHANTAMLGFLFPFVKDNHIETWQALGLTTLSFDLFKSISNDDPKNAQAAMSRIAGRLAFHDVLNNFRGKQAPKLMVIGAGALGISAAIEAVKCGIPVEIFGRKENLRKQFESQGMVYHVLPESSEQIGFIRKYLSDKTMVITAARIAGKKAPLLIDEQSLSFLPSHAVIADLVVSNGGNVVGSKHDQIVTLENNISIINVSGYPKKEPKTSSEAYAECVFNLILEIMTPQGECSFNNSLVQEIWVTHDKQRHDSIYDNFDELNTLRLK